MLLPTLPVFIGELSTLGAAASSIVFGKLSQRTGTKPVCSGRISGLWHRRSSKGATYGPAMSASALALGAGPRVRGVVAAIWGIRELSLVNSMRLVATILLAARLFNRSRGNM